MYLGECRDRGSRCCRPTSTRASCASRSTGQGRALRPDGDQERRRGRDRVAARRAREAGTHHVAARAVRRPRPAAGQQARVREPGQGRRLRLAAATGAAPGMPPRNSGRGCSRPSTPPASTARGAARSRARARRSSSAACDEADGEATAPAGAAAAGRGLDGASSSRSRKRRSACTGAGIRSIAIAAS